MSNVKADQLSTLEQEQLARPLRELYSRDLVRFLLQRLSPVVAEIAASRVGRAVAGVASAVEAIAAELGHPAGCDCGDELDRFNAAVADVEPAGAACAEWGVLLPGGAIIGPMSGSDAHDRAEATRGLVVQRVVYTTDWKPIEP